MKARALPLAAACLLAITSRTAGQDVSLERESLAGLDGLHVLVDSINEDGQEGGLTRGALRTYLEVRLRQAQIRVLSEDESLALERAPLLGFTVLVLPLTKGGWAYSLSLEVRQVTCITGGVEVGTCLVRQTWDVGGLYLTGKDLSDSVRGNVAELMDQLVNDYLAVNP